MKRLIWTIVVIVIVILIGISLSNNRPKEGQVTIGGLFNLTGYAAFAGEASRDGFIMALEDSISPWVAIEVPFVKPPYFWPANPSDRSEHQALTKYLANQGLKRVALIYSRNAWSDINTTMFKEEAAKYGISIVSEESFDQSVKDFRTAVAKIKNEKPDIIYSALADESRSIYFSSSPSPNSRPCRYAFFPGRITSYEGSISGFNAKSNIC
jgi:hypothetical protein